MRLFERKTPTQGAVEPRPAAPERYGAGRVQSTPPAPPPSAVRPTASPVPETAPPITPRPVSPIADKDSEMNTTPQKPLTSAPLGGSLSQPRRVVEAPGVAPRRPEAAPAAGADQQRRLIVGRDISLSGEIASCDILVVEGNVAATLRDGRSIEIAESGLFKGSVEIDEADIGGRFVGDILVRGRLRVRATGRIDGSIKYGELEVEAGGRLIGSLEVIEEGGLAPAGSAPIAETTPEAPAPFGGSLSD